MDVIGVFVDPRGIQGVHERHGLVSEVTYNIFHPMGVLVHAVGLPIDLMDVIGVFKDPVGVWNVLVDAVGLPIDLMEVIGVFVDPVGVWSLTKHNPQFWTRLPMNNKIFIIFHLKILGFAISCPKLSSEHLVKNRFIPGKMNKVPFDHEDLPLSKVPTTIYLGYSITLQIPG